MSRLQSNCCSSLPGGRRIYHSFSKYLMLVALIVAAALPKTTWARDADCGFDQVLEPGATYTLNNPEYPNNYTGARSCRWYATSATNVSLTCQTFSLPAGPHCDGDRLTVSPSGDRQLADGRNFCGTANVDITSTGKNMNIAWTALAGTTGGRFLCDLRATESTVPTCNCGQKNMPRIFGGEETGVNEYPMMAGLLFRDDRIIFCGATIISTKHVLSAAHCLSGLISLSYLRVSVGEHRGTITDLDSASVHTVSSLVSHPLYNSSTMANDIAVITVTDTIIFTAEVSPACLPFQTAFASFVGSQVYVLGWGLTAFGGIKSDVLRSAQLDVVQGSRCNATTNQICTYTPGQDTCQMDSGGPLLWQDPITERLVVIGIISFGPGCGSGQPGVNTRVGAYLEWILSVTPGVNYCRVE